MSPHYLVKLEMLIVHVLSTVVTNCYQKKLQNLFHCNCGLQIDVQNTHHWSGAIDGATNEWLPQWRHDPAWPTPFSVAVSVRPDHGCVSLHLLLQ